MPNAMTQAIGRRPIFYRPWMPFCMLALAGLAIFALFYQVPALDLAASSWFFTPSACLDQGVGIRICGQFLFSEMARLTDLRMALYYLPHLSGLVVLGLVLHQHWRHRWHPLTQTTDFARKGWIVLCALVVGPVILVNALLKTFSGRPRPNDTLLFGGDLPFVPVGDFSGACVQNCSFISGEASGMGWLLCLIALAPKAKRHLIAPPVIFLSILGAALRVAFGGHYLSDVLLGWLSSLLVLLGLAVLIGWPRAQKIG